jgi:hypothetical protein
MTLYYHIGGGAALKHVKVRGDFAFEPPGLRSSGVISNNVGGDDKVAVGASHQIT